MPHPLCLFDLRVCEYYETLDNDTRFSALSNTMQCQKGRGYRFCLVCKLFERCTNICKRMRSVHKEQVVPHCVPFTFLGSKCRLAFLHGFLQSLLINKWKQRNSLPGKLLAIHIQCKVRRVEICSRKKKLLVRTMIWLK